jgi:2-iminobutanoate/2-iminopropanoate deaminase
VSVRRWLTNADDIPAYAAIRAGVIKHEPTLMLGVVSGLVWPTLRVEIEVTAVRPASTT